MMPGHGAVFDLALEAIPDHEFITFAPFGDEAGRFRKVVAPIGVAQNNKFAMSFFDALAQCAAVALYGGVDNARAVALGDVNRGIAGAIVGNDYLAGNSGCLECGQGFINASPKGSFFV